MKPLMVILFILIFVAITYVMNFVFVPSNWASVDRWEQYSKTDDADTLFVGSSVGWVVVPHVIDENSDRRCVNMSTPNQFYKTSYEAVRFISQQRPLDTVVLLTGFEGLESTEDYGAAEAFLLAQYETAGFAKRACAVVSEKLGRYTDPEFLKSADSMNIWFDWVISSTYSVSEIIKNVAYRKSRTEDIYTLDMRKTIKRIDPSRSNPISIKEDIKVAQALNLSNLSIDSRSLTKLDDMASYLKANNIRFVVIVTPHRSDSREKYGEEYDVIDSYLREFVSKRDGEYYNIDSDPGLREQLPDDMFKDEEHIDDHGNNLVSMKIAELLR